MQVEEPGYEVHALTVVQLVIRHSIGPQDVVQVLTCDSVHVVEGSLHINLNRLNDSIGQVFLRNGLDFLVFLDCFLF